MSFPENEHTPIEPVSEYYAAVDRGLSVVRASSVAVVCLARDLGIQADRGAAIVESIASLFATWSAFVVENDSRDDTRSRLFAWRDRSAQVVVDGSNPGHRKWPSVRDGNRGAQLAGYRNTCLDHVRGLGVRPDYVIVIDLDLAGVSTEGVLHTLGSPGWDVVGSNGLQPVKSGWAQYDAWAWRDLGHPHGHHHTEINSRVFSRNQPLISVLSCFGGMAIYRGEAFAAGRYGGGDCEHVIFHKSLIQAGFSRIFCNPSQIARYDR